MKQFYLLIILLFSQVLVFSQKPHSLPKVHVTGTVIDKDSQQGLEYATLVFTPVNRKHITGGITDKQGKFDIEVPKGAYVISIEFISFKTKKLPELKITKDIDLGTIILTPDMEALDEVEIIAEKSTVEIHLDKKIYNVGRDMTVKGGNASDVLDNVPSVTVDVEGNVSLRGNESVRILIDGKPSGLVGMNSTDALRQLPAEAIQKVEVITSPSARYEAEGTAGIINIILRKSKAQGFNASTTFTVGYHENAGISGNINYRGEQFNLFSNLGYNHKESPGNAHFENVSKLTNTTTNEEFREYLRGRNRLNINLGLEYYLSKNSSVTGSVLYKNSLGTTKVANDGFKYDSYQNISLETNRSEDEDSTNNLIEYAFNFTQKFKTHGHKLTFDLKYQDGSDDENSIITDTTIFPDNTTNSLEKITTLEQGNRLLIKSDYVLPIGKDKQFEAGFQSSLKNTNTDYKVEINTEGIYVTNEDVSNILDYKENISALYTQYGNKFGKFSALLGLRMEYTDIDIQVTGIDLNVTKKYTQLFPTANLSYELQENENITLGFNRRIRRPRSRHMSPFPTRSSTTNIFQGNPDLDPIFTNAVDIAYFKKWSKITFTTSVYYQHAENAFQYVREDSGMTNDDGIPIIITTPINLNDENRIGAEFSINYNPAKWLRLSNSFNFYQFETNGVYNTIDYGTKSQSWFNRFSSKIKLFDKVDFQSTLFYRGPYKSAVSNRKGLLMANLAFSKDVFKDKGTLSLNVSDLFNTRKRQMETYYDTFTNYTEYQWRERQINLNFTYRFHQKKSRNRQGRGNFEGGDDFEG